MVLKTLLISFVLILVNFILCLIPALLTTPFIIFFSFIEKSIVIAQEVYKKGQRYELDGAIRQVIVEDTVEQWVNFLLPELYTPVFFAKCRICELF